jgi:hypothetical protein
VGGSVIVRFKQRHVAQCLNVHWQKVRSNERDNNNNARRGEASIASPIAGNDPRWTVAN